MKNLCVFGVDYYRQGISIFKGLSSFYTKGFLLACLILAGCSRTPGEIFNQTDLDLTKENEGKIITTGARQRAILTIDVDNTKSKHGKIFPERLVCAEPSPDVGVVLATSLSASLSVLMKASASLSRDQAEGMAQLVERTVTIQLLRDQMYRACEAFANGAISGTSYSLLMSKNNDAMVTLMLGETAGGAYGRSGAVLGGKASSEATASFTGAMKDFKDGLANMTEAEKKVLEADEKKKTAEATLADKKKIQEDEKDKSDDQKTADKKAVKEAEDNVKAAELNLEAAKNARDKIEKTLQSSSDAASKAAAEISTATGFGGLDRPPDAKIAEQLVLMQGQYLNDSMGEDYMAACLVELGLNTENMFNPRQTFEEDKNAFISSGLFSSDLAEQMQLYQYYASVELDAYEIPLPNDTMSKDDHYKRYQEFEKAAENIRNKILQNGIGLKSSLALDCKEKLWEIMTQAEKDRHNIVIATLANKVEIKALDVKGKFYGLEALLVFKESWAECDKMKTEAKKQQCRNSVAKVVDRSAEAIALDSKDEQPGTDEPSSPGSKDPEACKISKYDPLAVGVALQAAIAQDQKFIPGKITFDALTVPTPHLPEYKGISARAVKVETDSAKILHPNQQMAIQALHQTWTQNAINYQSAVATQETKDAERFCHLVEAEQIELTQKKAELDALTKDLGDMAKEMMAFEAKITP